MLTKYLWTVDEELLRQIKICAAEDRTTIANILRQASTKYLEERKMKKGSQK